MSGDIKQFGGMPPQETYGRTLSNSYAREMAPIVSNKLIELGADEELAEITCHHLEDLYLVKNNALLLSRLDVALIPGEGQKRIDPIRVANFSARQLARYQKRVHENLVGLGGEGIRQEELAPVTTLHTNGITETDPLQVAAREIAFEWIFFELSADALSNSAYMRQNFGKYIGDFDGQSRGYEAEMFIARKYVKNLPREEGKQKPDPREVLFALRAGVAMELLHDMLIRRGYISSERLARKFIETLCNNYPHIKKQDRDGLPLQPQVDPMHRKTVREAIGAVHEERGVQSHVALAEVVELVFAKSDKE